MTIIPSPSVGADIKAPGRVFRRVAYHRVHHAGDTGHLPHVVDTHDVGAAHDRKRDRRGGTFHAVVRRQVERVARQALREVREAVLSEWIDFLLVPMPESFVIYADHDEYTTFFARREEQLSGVVEALTAARFREVDYVRTF